jgi:hypothetical protein
MFGQLPEINPVVPDLSDLCPVTCLSMHEIFSKFTTLLSERLTLDRPTKEDDVRYTFFYAAVVTGPYRHTDVCLEIPHPGLKGREVDAVLLDADSNPAIILEFKYDKRVNSTVNVTNRAGSVFNDLVRLASAEFGTRTKRYLVYLTDPVMHGYFSSDVNGFLPFYEADAIGGHSVTTDFLSRRQASFTSQLKVSALGMVLKGIFRANLPRGHSLTIFEVARL